MQRVERLTPEMVRVVLGGEDLADFAVEQADSYVKLVFPLPGVTYPEPFDVAAVRAQRPREEWPAQRTYSVRAVADGEVTIDFVVHGDEGIAGPWAAAAQPGDEVWMLGPGGAYTPAADAAWHLLVGDASALPAISASLERVPAGATAVAVVEVHSPAEELPLTSPGDLRLHWVHRAAPDPEALVEFLRTLDLPSGAPHAFVHGEADTVRAVRRWARTDLGVTRELLSASGYWRRGRTEDGWREEKRDWVAATETDDASAGV
ncbi:siderophore-interacting protein [Kineococcus sp. NPDC059986]|uniref:siderophore-interacting protein n=1 Tax=Kineococcus sp. NPDC059986 TaxID=3155538 RepID=UPI00344FC517